MKTSRLPKPLRKIRRIDLLSKRETTNYEHRRFGRSFIQSKTTRKVFKKGRFGRVTIEHVQTPYPHSSARQNARYARLAAGKLQMDIITTAPPVDAKPARKRLSPSSSHRWTECAANV